MTIIETHIPRSLQLAAKFAERSNSLHRMGCVIIKNGRLISAGWNKNRTHPQSKTRYNNIHAELDSIIGVPRHILVGSQLFVIRLTKKGVMGTSKPCRACAELLHTLDLKSMTYIDSEGKVCLQKL